LLRVEVRVAVTVEVRIDGKPRMKMSWDLGPEGHISRLYFFCMHPEALYYYNIRPREIKERKWMLS
jgi:hypothetical protein